MSTRSTQFAWHALVSLTFIAATTGICYRLIPVNATTAGFAYLLAVLVVSTVWGMPAAVIAAVGAMLCLNFFFLPPVGQLTISDAQNWVALFAFLATALVASNLSERAKKQAGEARSRQRETEQLYTLSRTILLTNPSQSVGFQAAQHIAEIFQCPTVALYDAQSGDIFRGGAEDLPGIEFRLKQIALEGANRRDDGVLAAAIVLGGRSMGAIAVKGLHLSDSALQALLNLVAISLERVRAEELASRAEAARQSEEFKSTLLDAIAHEFKTPLTSIKAASTSILSDRQSLTPQFRELATIIDEEADRLSILVTEAVRMSQIDAGKLRLHREPLDMREFVRQVIGLFASRTEGRDVRISASAGLAPVYADKDLVSLALRQLIDNALKYSPPGSPIEISASSNDHRVVVTVHDCGPEIPERERERVFDKFYRRVTNNIPGTGLGLYIAREIARAHGGDVWIEGGPGTGSEFRLALPMREHGE